MKKIFFGVLASLALSLVVVSCSSDDDNDQEYGYKDFEEFKDITANYVDKTVIATYVDMKAGGDELVAAVAKLVENKTQPNLDAAADAWKHTRKAWESSEAFLYGPAADEGLDPSLDSWPLDQTMLDQILAGTDAINHKALSNNVRGFHALEYLIFSEGENIAVSEISDREMTFLVAVTAGLSEDINTLHDGWVDSYGAEFKALSPQAQAIEQLIDGITTITDEVGNAKIKDPYESKNVLDVESWFSWNSLTDFVNNIKGAQNAYLGGYVASTRTKSLHDFVESQNADLDEEVMDAFENTIAAIKAIGEPFRNQLNNADKKDEIEAAMKACADLTDLFDQKVKALVVY